MDALFFLPPALAAGPACEFLCRLPRQAPWGRARLSGCLGLAAALYLVLLWVTLKPAFAALGVWASLAALAFTNNAKLAALREPLLADDRAELFLVATHPGFYLPFLSRAQAAGLVCAALAVPAALLYSPGLTLPGLPDGLAGLLLRLALGAAAGLALWGLLRLRLLARMHAALTGDPVRDMARLGFFSTFSLSLLCSWDAAPRRAMRAAPCPLPSIPARDPDSLPHLVAVQAEAFCDMGRLHPELAPLLPGWNALRAAGALAAPIRVPAFGANTIRTEFAFLTGLAPEAIGLERFQPYARLARKPMDALPARLAAAGYRTLCLHPNAGAFYRRDKVLPNLGFQDFLDLPRLGHLERFGPHAADAALADCALGLLRSSREPLFLFLVSMENHSPWLPGRLGEAELTGAPAALGGRPLSHAARCYLRHLMNADAMLSRLAEGLAGLRAATGRSAVLCFYGDHQPNLPELQPAGRACDERSDALLWRPEGCSDRNMPAPGDAHRLPLALLCCAGLAGTAGDGAP